MEFIQAEVCLVFHSLYLLVLVQQLAAWLLSITEHQLYLTSLDSVLSVFK